jgi:hypothetical protein
VCNYLNYVNYVQIYKPFVNGVKSNWVCCKNSSAVAVVAAKRGFRLTATAAIKFFPLNLTITANGDSY